MFRTIATGIDFTPLSLIGLEAASEMARLSDARQLHLVHVLEAERPWIEGGRDTSERIDDARRRLEALRVPSTSGEVTRIVRVGSPARELAEEASAIRADLVVVSSHDRSDFGRVVIGSVAATLLRVLDCPILIVGKDRPLELAGDILAAIDLSSVSERVLETALRLARPSHRRVRAFSVSETSPESSPTGYENKYRGEIAHLIRRCRMDEVDVDIDVAREASPAEAILERARSISAGMIVLGASGHNAWHRVFLGSTTTRVAVRADSPVLVVPHPPEAPQYNEVTSLAAAFR